MASEGDQNLESEERRTLHPDSPQIGFSREEMVACGACGKANAPTRPSCLYCGEGLEHSGITRFDIRQPESWESGFNVVMLDASGADTNRAAVQLASLLGVDRDVLLSILTAGKALPLARVESESQAAGVSQTLSELGIKTMIVADDDLHPKSTPARLRSLTFEGDKLRLELFNGSEIRTLDRDDLALIVPGVIFEERTESIEKRKLRGSKTLSETETSSDGPVIDIYSRNDAAGRRIPASGFDFSCLGSEKSLIVAENMKRLVATLADFSPGARLVEDYVKVRSMLELAWPAESRRESQRLARNRKEVSNVSTSNNAVQLTKYSRLQWRLYEEKV
ncbi:MAG: hypothetical protein ABIO91_01970 [Pyrinomonadaceae bacterium]